MRSQPQSLVLAAERTTTEHDRLLAFIARLCVVLIFPFSCPALLLVLGGTLEAIGPLCILFGFYRRQAALLFIFYVIATAVLFHNFWNFPFNGEMWNENFWPFLKNLGLAGGFLYIAADAKMQSLRGAFSLSSR